MSNQRVDDPNYRYYYGKENGKDCLYAIFTYPVESFRDGYVRPSPIVDANWRSIEGGFVACIEETPYE